MDIDITQKFLSHSDGKLLSTHLRGVSAGVRKRTSLKTAEIAAIFHDLGKINPNFQNKLAGLKTGYSGHAYLSALAWLCFCQANRELVKELFGSNPLAMIEVAAMVARHHGDLPDFAEGIFKERPRATNIPQKTGRIAHLRFLATLTGPFRISANTTGRRVSQDIQFAPDSRLHYPPAGFLSEHPIWFCLSD
jgi:CRISPR-associated endonuclease Cas3-HD